MGLMKSSTLPSRLAVALLLCVSFSLRAEEWSPGKDESKDSPINGRDGAVPARGEAGTGYPAPQQDTFIMVHPVTDRQDAPLKDG